MLPLITFNVLKPFGRSLRNIPPIILGRLSINSAIDVTKMIVAIVISGYSSAMMDKTTAIVPSIMSV